MNNYLLLLEDFKIKFNKDYHDYLFRISASIDLDKVKNFGSSRYGFAKKSGIDWMITYLRIYQSIHYIMMK